MVIDVSLEKQWIVAITADVCSRSCEFFFSSFDDAIAMADWTRQTSDQRRSFQSLVLIKSRIHIFHVHFSNVGERETHTQTTKFNCTTKKNCYHLGMTGELTISTELRNQYARKYKVLESGFSSFLSSAAMIWNTCIQIPKWASRLCWCAASRGRPRILCSGRSRTWAASSKNISTKTFLLEGHNFFFVYLRHGKGYQKRIDYLSFFFL